MGFEPANFCVTGSQDLRLWPAWQIPARQSYDSRDAYRFRLEG